MPRCGATTQAPGYPEGWTYTCDEEAETEGAHDGDHKAKVRGRVKYQWPNKKKVA